MSSIPANLRCVTLAKHTIKIGSMSHICWVAVTLWTLECNDMYIIHHDVGPIVHPV